MTLKWPYSSYICRASDQKFDFFLRFFSPHIGSIGPPIRGHIGGEMGVKRDFFGPLFLRKSGPEMAL